jgi:RimJ/RimL family protein N-acetyltransferase
VSRWLSPPPRERLKAEDADRILRHDLLHWDTHGFGPWVLTARSDAGFVGRGGLVWTRIERRPMVELPWSVRPGLQGRGFATEAARAALGVALGLGLGPLVSLTLPDNRASRAVMEKLGFSYQREVSHAGMPHVLYGFEPPSPR